MSRIRVELADRSYDIEIGSSITKGLGSFARQRVPSRLAVVVTDANVNPHLEAVCSELTQVDFEVKSVTIDSGESQKSLEVASSLYDELAELRADRRTLIVALGGGVIGDLAGFVAATYNRGLALLMLPTTLLSMVDSSVGGKTGVNHPRGKNLIGAFHQPVGVWIDTDFLTTLPDREYRSGLAEIVKYGVILDAELFAFLEANVEGILARDAKALEHIIERSCQLKADVVEQDEREEKGLRAVLNYGHTFAHAFETIGGYGTWLHGEAVAAGMMCASRLAERQGLVSDEIRQRQHRLFQAFDLPVAPCEGSINEFVRVMRNDKKSVGGKLRFILPTRLGEVRLFDDVREETVVEVLHELREANNQA